MMMTTVFCVVVLVLCSTTSTSSLFSDQVPVLVALNFTDSDVCANVSGPDAAALYPVDLGVGKCGNSPSIDRGAIFVSSDDSFICLPTTVRDAGGIFLELVLLPSVSFESAVPTGYQVIFSRFLSGPASVDVCIPLFSFRGAVDLQGSTMQAHCQALPLCERDSARMLSFTVGGLTRKEQTSVIDECPALGISSGDTKKERSRNLWSEYKPYWIAVIFIVVAIVIIAIIVGLVIWFVWYRRQDNSSPQSQCLELSDQQQQPPNAQQQPNVQQPPNTNGVAPSTTELTQRRLSDHEHENPIDQASEAETHV